jgi:hypothetical protein
MPTFIDIAIMSTFADTRGLGTGPTGMSFEAGGG